MKVFRISALCLLGVLGVASMASAQNWSRRYNGTGSGNDVARSIAADSSGNVYVTGNSDGTAATGIDFTTIKYNSAGAPQWYRRYDGAAHGNDSGKAIAVDSGGNVYVTGTSQGVGTGSDIATVKYAPDGTRLWVKRYDGSGHELDAPSSIVVDPAGGVYVAGGSLGATTEIDYVLIKYDAAGNRPWVKRYDGPSHGYDFASAVALDPAHNVYVTGGSTGVGTQIDFATLKYDSTGHLLYKKRYNSPSNMIDFANALVVDDSGNAHVTGNSWRSATESHYVTIKYDTAGITLWKVDYNNVQLRDIPWGIALDVSGNVFVTGQSEAVSTKLDYLTFKYDANGNFVWKQRYDGIVGNDDIAYALAVDPAGNIFVTGTSYTNATDQLDIVTLKYDNNGSGIWRKVYAGAGHRTDAGYAITTDSAGNCYVAGVVCTVGLPTLTLVDYVTIKYAP